MDFFSFGFFICILCSQLYGVWMLTYGKHEKNCFVSRIAEQKAKKGPTWAIWYFIISTLSWDEFGCDLSQIQICVLLQQKKIRRRIETVNRRSSRIRLKLKCFYPWEFSQLKHDGCYSAFSNGKTFPQQRYTFYINWNWTPCLPIVELRGRSERAADTIEQDCWDKVKWNESSSSVYFRIQHSFDSTNLI